MTRVLVFNQRSGALRGEGGRAAIARVRRLRTSTRPDSSDWRTKLTGVATPVVLFTSWMRLFAPCVEPSATVDPSDSSRSTNR